MILYNKDLQNVSIVFEIAKVALENSVPSKIVGKELNLSSVELDKLYEMITHLLTS
jgi:hypothetical protein